MSCPARGPEICVYAGDTLAHHMVFRDLAGELVHLDYWGDWRAQFKTGATVIDATVHVVDDVVTVALPPSKTRALTAGGEYDIQASRQGVIRTWCRGPFKWSDDITKGGGDA